MLPLRLTLTLMLMRLGAVTMVAYHLPRRRRRRRRGAHVVCVVCIVVLDVWSSNISQNIFSNRTSPSLRGSVFSVVVSSFDLSQDANVLGAADEIRCKYTGNPLCIGVI